MSTSQKHGIITLLEKDGKDKALIKNWRPISLLNIDTKLLSKCLSLRLIKHLSNLVHPTQLAYVKERFIGEGIRLIEDLMEYTKSLDIPGLIVAIDFQKAFDSVHHDYIYKVLEKMNIGPKFISWVKCLYHNIESTVMNNGQSTGYFSINRGVRQGDPLSPYLFILALEPLLTVIRENEQIHGIHAGNTEHKLSAYADDITALVGDRHSLDQLLKLFDNFEEISLLTLNKDKTEILGIGSMDGYSARNKGLQCCQEGIKITGFFSFI